MKKVRIGVVGAGGRGSGFANMANTHPDAELAALADANVERATRLQKEMGFKAPVFDSIEAMLNGAAMDAVIIATPDYQHVSQALVAFEAKKHVLLEKPIATTVADSLTILKASRKQNRVLYMGFNLRHNVVVREMKRLISEQNAVGKPFFLMAVEYYNGGKTYMARWNRLRKYSGGLWVHKGTHDFDVLNWLNAPAHPAWVSATAAVNILNMQHLPFKLKKGEKVGPTCHQCQVAHKCPDKSPSGGSWRLFDDETAKSDGYHKDLCIFQSDKDTHDNGMAIVEYDNGSRAFHSEVFITTVDNRFYTVVGELGHMEADMGGLKIDLMPRWTRHKVTHNLSRPTGGHGGSDPTLMDGFVNSILRKERPLAGAIDGVWSLAVGCAAEIARDEKRVVEIKELLDPTSDLLKAK